MSKVRILVVEDEAVIGLSLKQCLEDMGYGVDGPVNTGEVAIQQVATHKPSLVLMDTHLAGELDGISAAAQIYQVFHVPIIYLTAHSEPSDLERAKQTSPYGYLLKPIQNRQLQAAIETALQRVQTEQRLLGGYDEMLDQLRRTQQLASSALHQSLHDAITGLPNEPHFINELDRFIKMPPALSRQTAGIVLLEVDRFHELSLSLASDLRHQWLRKLAQQLTTAVNALCVARLSHNQFALLIPVLPLQYLDRFLTDLLAIAEQPIWIGDQEIVCSFSSGVALLQEHNRHQDDLLNSANIALAQAKSLGHGRWVTCSPDLHRRTIRRCAIEKELRFALEQDELQVFYQPIVALDTCNVRGFEALVRWNHPKLGLIGPDSFLPLAEETGLIVPLGWQVLEQATQQIATWMQQFQRQDLFVAVNLSWQQLLHPQLITYIIKALQRTQLAAHQLHIEIVEDTLTWHLDQAQETLSLLAHIGVHLAIDDFGIGYSSLARLNQVPVQAVKVDRSFSQQLGSATGDELVNAIVNLAHNLQLEVVAEGIETMEQIKFLQTLGCDSAQGYLLGRPLPANLAAQALAEPEHLQRATWWFQDPKSVVQHLDTWPARKSVASNKLSVV